MEIIYGFHLSSSNSSRAVLLKMYTVQKQPPEVFCKKVVFRNFAKLTKKHLCRSLFFNKLQASCEISKNTFFTEHSGWLILPIIRISWFPHRKSSHGKTNYKIITNFKLIITFVLKKLFIKASWVFKNSVSLESPRAAKQMINCVRSKQSPRKTSAK